MQIAFTIQAVQSDASRIWKSNHFIAYCRYKCCTLYFITALTFIPSFPTMYYNIFQQKDRKLEIWLKSANIKYKRPATTDLHLTFTITPTDIIEAENALNKVGKFEIWHTVQAINTKGIVCAEAEMLVYLRDNKIKSKIGF